MKAAHDEEEKLLLEELEQNAMLVKASAQAEMNAHIDDEFNKKK